MNFRSFSCILLTLFISTTYGSTNTTVPFGLGSHCRTEFVRVDGVDNLYIASEPADATEFGMNQRHEKCSLSMKTGKVDHGICLSVKEVTLSCDVDILFSTNIYEPDKKLTCKTSRPLEWCTTNSILTLTLEARHTRQSALVGPIFNFQIQVDPVPMDHIIRKYYMDSKLSCNAEYALSTDETVHVISHRYPAINKATPSECNMTFSSLGTDEYEQICFRFDGYIMDCGSELFTDDLLVPHWNPNETFNCWREVSKEEEYCSQNKRLTLSLTREATQNSPFAIRVQSKRHPYWEYDAQVKRELVGLAIVRALILVVSVINALVALAVALFMFLYRNPLSSINQWSIRCILYIPNKSEITGPTPTRFEVESNDIGKVKSEAAVI